MRVNLSPLYSHGPAQNKTYFWPDVWTTVSAPTPNPQPPPTTNWSRLQMKRSFQQLFLEAVTILLGIKRSAGVTSQVVPRETGHRGRHPLSVGPKRKPPYVNKQNKIKWKFGLQCEFTKREVELCRRIQLKDQLNKQCQAITTAFIISLFIISYIIFLIDMVIFYIFTVPSLTESRSKMGCLSSSSSRPSDSSSIPSCLSSWWQLHYIRSSHQCVDSWARAKK